MTVWTRKVRTSIFTLNRVALPMSYCPESVCKGYRRRSRSRRISNVNPGLSNVPGHNSASANGHMIADRNGEHGRIRSDTDAITDRSRPPQVVIIAGRTPVNKYIVDEHYPVRNETIVSNRDAIADERVGLNPASSADTYSLLYFHERSHEGFVADGAPIKINRLDENNPLAKLNIDDADLSNFRVPPQKRNSAVRFQPAPRLETAMRCRLAIANQKPLFVSFSRADDFRKVRSFSPASSHMQLEDSCQPCPTAILAQPGDDHRCPFCFEARVAL